MRRDRLAIAAIVLRCVCRPHVSRLGRRFRWPTHQLPRDRRLVSRSAGREPGAQLPLASDAGSVRGRRGAVRADCAALRHADGDRGRFSSTAGMPRPKTSNASPLSRRRSMAPSPSSAPVAAGTKAVRAAARPFWRAALLAVLPGHFMDRTMLGFVDHHALEALLAVATLLAIVMGCKRRPGPSIRASILRTALVARPLPARRGAAARSSSRSSASGWCCSWSLAGHEDEREPPALSARGRSSRCCSSSLSRSSGCIATAARS